MRSTRLRRSSQSPVRPIDDEHLVNNAHDVTALGTGTIIHGSHTPCATSTVDAGVAAERKGSAQRLRLGKVLHGSGRR